MLVDVPDDTAGLCYKRPCQFRLRCRFPEVTVRLVPYLVEDPLVLVAGHNLGDICFPSVPSLSCQRGVPPGRTIQRISVGQDEEDAEAATGAFVHNLVRRLKCVHTFRGFYPIPTEGDANGVERLRDTVPTLARHIESRNVGDVYAHRSFKLLSSAWYHRSSKGGSVGSAIIGVVVLVSSSKLAIML